MNASYSITSKHQVTVPKEVRKSLKLKKGQGVRFVKKGNMYFLDAVPTIADAQKLNVKNNHRKDIASQEELDAARHAFASKKLKW